MYATERQDEIVRSLERVGRVSVVELAERLAVTTETVRRDLDALERAGALRRVHGGAVALERASTAETAIAERARLRGEQKTRIARRALEAIGDRFRGSVFVDAGSTAATVASGVGERVRETGARVEVVTHSVPAASVLSMSEDLPLTLIGGRVRGITAAAVGTRSVRDIERLRPDVAFVGTNGISVEFGLSTPDPDEAAVKEAVVRGARRVVLLADASKFARDYLVRFASLGDIDVLVTDEQLPTPLAQACAESDVEVWVA